jgi:transcriptional regulator with XRE-family HTH domain
MTKDQIKSIRKTLGLNAHDFGDKVGVSGRTVESWEQGLRVPSKAVIIIINQIKKENKMKQIILNEAVELVNSYRDSWDSWFPQSMDKDKQAHEIYDKADSMGLQAKFSPPFYEWLEEIQEEESWND